MNIVYALINNDAYRSDSVEPFLYIGSKVDCEVVDNVILDRHGKEYWSSSKNVASSVDAGDKWELFSYFEVSDRKDGTKVEGEVQDIFDCANSSSFFNLSHANGKFNSMGEGVGESISKALTGKRRPDMFEPEYYAALQTPEARANNSKARIGNKNVIYAAKNREANRLSTPEGRARKAEIARKAFTGRKLTEYEFWLRRHDDRFKPNRTLTNEQVWDIRFGQHKSLSLNELCDIYPVSKATLSRVRNFKVFKDITEDSPNGKQTA